MSSISKGNALNYVSEYVVVEEIAIYRIKCTIQNVKYLIDSGRIIPSYAVAIISNLADTDKEEAETQVEHMVFDFVKEMESLY
jgi:hypothetical protein